MSMSSPEVRYVLAHGSPAQAMAMRWQYKSSNGFFDDLLVAAARADAENLAKIESVFPSVGEAVRRWKTDPEWVREMEMWARANAENTPCSCGAVVEDPEDERLCRRCLKAWREAVARGDVP